MLAKRYTLLLGAYFALTGAWGFFSPVFLGSFTTNKLQAEIGIALAVAAFAFMNTSRVNGYLIGAGCLLTSIGLLRFMTASSELMISLLNVNMELATIDVIIGVVTLAVGAQPEDRTAQVRPMVAQRSGSPVAQSRSV